jgi:hypothetical protein
MKVVLTATQFTASLNPSAPDPLYRIAFAGELQGAYEIKCNLSAADVSTMFSSVASAGGTIGAPGTPVYYVADSSGNVTKLMIAYVSNGGPVPVATLLAISGAYALSTLTALFPALTLIPVNDILEN